MPINIIQLAADVVKRAETADAGAEQASSNEPSHLTDLGNAERLVKLHGKDLRYCAQTGVWLVWDGRRWAVDQTGEVFRRATNTVKTIYAEATLYSNPMREEIAKHAIRSESSGKIAAMVRLAESERSIAVAPNQLDADPWLLNVLNGTINLRTGELRSHRREDLITKLAPVEYDPEARLKQWDDFLADATGGDKELADFLQRAVGYSLTGDTREEVLFLVHGPSRTGKSTFLEAVKATMGDYAQTADFETFVKRQSVGGPRNDIACLGGARAVISIEVDEGKRLAEGLVKMITGGDTLRARYLYKESFEFRPQFKLWLAANHAPKVKADDDAMWNRILRVPFERVVPKERRSPKVKATLTNPEIAGPAILAWAVEGALIWQRNGLGVPPVVEKATESYRLEMSPLHEFIAECCEQAPDAWTPADKLRAAYEEWAEERGEGELLSPTEFTSGLRAHGCEPARRHAGRGWVGIRLRDA